jgi:predicted nucleic acid-binding protein
LLDTRADLNHGRDHGEAEAIVQAAQRSATMILVDDALGREWAKDHDIECHGTLWLLDQLRTNGSIAALRPHFEQLIQSQRRQPLDLMNAFLGKHGEPPLG